MLSFLLQAIAAAQPTLSSKKNRLPSSHYSVLNFILVCASVALLTTCGSPAFAAASLTALSLSPTSVAGGTSSTGTVTLSAAAPTGGTVVSLSSNDVAKGVTVPSSVTVAVGKTSGTFTTATTPVTANISATISATLGSTTKTTTIAVTAPVLSGVTLSPTSVIGGTSSTGTVTLSSPAPTGGTAVSLSSNSTSKGVTVPASVTVASGSTTATFTTSTTGVTANVSATISAVLGSTTKTAALTVTAPTLLSAALNPTPVTGGASSSGTVTLSGPAPAGGTVVTLSSNDVAKGVTVPASVTVASGSTSATFTTATTAVTANITATISATLGATTKTATLTVAVPTLLSVTLNPTSVVGGSSSAGTVSLTGPAPTGGIAVSLSSNSTTSGITVPASVTVAPGQTTAAFSVSTTAVASNVTATITGTQGSTTKTVTLAVTAPTFISLQVNPSIVLGGAASTGAVNISSAAPTGGLTFALSSNSTASGVTVPSSVTIAAGQTSASFTVSTTTVGVTVNAIISGTLGLATKTATLTVSAPNFVSVQLIPSTVVGGASSAGAVNITSAAPAGGMTIALSSNSTASGVTVPSSATIAAGQTSGSFTVSTTAVAATVNAIISGTLGSTTQTAPLTVTAPTLISVQLNPSSVVGGTSSNGTVNLSSAAPAAGLVVVLSSNSTGVTVPSSVTVAAGQTSAAFTVSTTAVAANLTAIITGTLGSGTQTANLAVTSPNFISVQVNPSIVLGGATSTGTVNITSAAPAGGLTIALSSNSTASGVTVPSSVTIAAGQTSGSFIVSTTPVAATVNAIISGTLGSNTQTATLAVTAPTLVGISFSPTSVVGGTSSTGTVTISSAAPTGGLVVSLSSNNAAVTVPSSVTVAAGQTSAGFSASTTPVASNISATITGTLGSTSTTATLAVTAPTLVGILLNPTAVYGGASSAGIVTISSAAPTGGLTIVLSSNSTASGVTVPATSTIAVGQTSGSFSVSTTIVAATVNATISATLGSTTNTAQLTVTAPAVVSVSLNPTSVIGGYPSSGTLTLSAPAPSGGLVVTLSSDSTANGVNVYGPIGNDQPYTIAAGQTTGTFDVTTLPVASNLTANISATVGSSTQSAPLTVLAPTLISLQITPTSVNSGNNAIGILTFSGPPTSAGITVALSSNSVSSGVTVPSTVTLQSGQTIVFFNILTTGLSSSITATISATQGSTTLTGQLVVIPSTILNLQLSPTSVLGGTSSQGGVAITGLAPPAGFVVALSSDSTAYGVTVPSTVTIPSGQNVAYFNIATTVLAANHTATIGASLNGSSKTASLSVIGPTLVSLSLNPTTIVAGNVSAGTVTISGPAPSGGISVSLTGYPANSSVSVPASVFIAAGQTTGIFTISTQPVASTVSEPIYAYLYGAFVSATLTVQPGPPTLQNVVLASTTVSGGNSTTVTVNLSGPAPSGGVYIALTASDPSVSVINEVFIPAGQTSVSATVSTSVVSQALYVTITAAVYGTTQSTYLTVNPYMVTSVSLNPSTVTGTYPTSVTVTISDIPSNIDVTVPLVTGSTAVELPSSVIIPSGVNTITFPVNTTRVTTTTTALIAVNLNGTTASATLTIVPPSGTVAPIASVSLSAPTIPNEGLLTGTVTLAGAASIGGAVVSLTSSVPSALAVPATVLVPAGTNTVSFTAAAASPAQPINVTVSAQFQGVTVTTGVWVDGAAAGSTGSSGLATGGLELTPAGVAQGFSLSNVANFYGPNTTYLTPTASAVTSKGNILVEGGFNPIFYSLPLDADGQPALSSEVGSPGYESVATVDGTNIYAVTPSGQVYSLNPDGSTKSSYPTFNFAGPDIAVNPVNGHIISDTGFDNDPIAGTSTHIANVSIGGVAVSPDGTTAYFADFYTGTGDIVGYNIATGNQVYDSGPTIGSPNGIVVGSGSLAGELFSDDYAGTVTEYNLATGTQTIIASGGGPGSLAKADQTNGSLLLGGFSPMLLRITPPAGGSFGVPYGKVIVTRDDTGQVADHGGIAQSYDPITFSNPTLTGASDRPAAFDLTGLTGVIGQGAAERAGSLSFETAGALDLQWGLASVASGGPVSYGAGQPALELLPTDPTLYNSSWSLPSSYLVDIESQLGGIYNATLTDQVNSLIDVFQVTDTPQASWPFAKNLLSLTVNSPLSGINVSQGRTIDLGPSGADQPFAGTWDIINGPNGGPNTVVGSSGYANGWDVALDGTSFGGFIVTVPASAAAASHYEVRYAGLGSSGFTVTTAGTTTSAPQMLPISFSANPTHFLSAPYSTQSATITLDAPAPATGATIALSNNNPLILDIPAFVNIAPGATSVTFPISEIEQYFSSDTLVTFTAEYNGFRTGTLDLTREYDGNPLDYQNQYPTPTGGPFSVIVGPSGVSNGPFVYNFESSYPSGPQFNLAAASAAGQVSLTWSAVPSSPNYSPVLGYNLLRSSSQSGPFTPIFSGLSTTAFTDVSVTAGNTYYYAVVAVNLAGPSAYSNIVSGIPTGN